MFAISDAVSLALIGLAVILVNLATLVIKDILDQRRADRVATELKLTGNAQLAQMLSVAEKIEEVHLATNSMKDALVLSTEKEALARGIKQGQESHDQQRD